MRKREPYATTLEVNPYNLGIPAKWGNSLHSGILIIDRPQIWWWSHKIIMNETFLSPEDSEVIINVIPQHSDHVCGDVSINKPITNQLLERTMQTYMRHTLDNQQPYNCFTIYHIILLSLFLECIPSIHKKKVWNWRDGSAGNVLAMNAWGPECKSQKKNLDINGMCLEP